MTDGDDLMYLRGLSDVHAVIRFGNRRTRRLARNRLLQHSWCGWIPHPGDCFWFLLGSSGRFILLNNHEIDDPVTIHMG